MLSARGPRWCNYSAAEKPNEFPPPHGLTPAEEISPYHMKEWTRSRALQQNAAVGIEGQVQASGSPLANSTVTLWQASARA